MRLAMLGATKFTTLCASLSLLHISNQVCKMESWRIIISRLEESNQVLRISPLTKLMGLRTLTGWSLNCHCHPLIQTSLLVKVHWVLLAYTSCCSHFADYRLHTVACVFYQRAYRCPQMEQVTILYSSLKTFHTLDMHDCTTITSTSSARQFINVEHVYSSVKYCETFHCY